MPRHPQLYEWTKRVATAFPELPTATARVLADWSYGLVLAHTCGLSIARCRRVVRSVAKTRGWC